MTASALRGVVAIINCSPDSFSGDGSASIQYLIEQCQQAVRDGAALLDIGAESTRPGARPVDAATELQRLLPVLAAVKRNSTLPISVDTSKAEVAVAALDAGAVLINDISGGRDPAMLPLIAERQCPVILMHNSTKGGSVITGDYGTAYTAADVDTDGYIERLFADMNTLAQRAQEAGIASENVILDPGIGFGKTVLQNLMILRHLPQLASLGYPLLIGLSRKSFLGAITAEAEATRRDDASTAAHAIAALHGAALLRAHNVRAAVQAWQVAHALHHA